MATAATVNPHGQFSAEAQKATVTTKDGAARPRVGKFKQIERPTFESIEQQQRYIRGRLATAARIADDFGFGIGCHIGLSARDPKDRTRVWVIPRGRPLMAVRSSDLITVDLEGNVLETGESGKPVDPEWLNLHLSVYRVRPDVGGIATGHTPHGRAYSVRGEEPKMLWQDSCVYYKTIHVLPFAEGVNPVDDKIKAAIKDGKALILENRGLLCAQGTIDGAIGSLVRLENLCGNEMLVEAAIKGVGGDLVLIGEEEAQFTYDNTGKDAHQWFAARPYFDRVDRRTGGAYVI